MSDDLFSGVELDVISMAGHPFATDFDEIGLARRVLELPDTGSEHWYTASAVTLAAAYVKLRAKAAAAPDLYAALKIARQFIEDDVPPWHLSERLAVIDAALSKAEGQS